MAIKITDTTVINDSREGTFDGMGLTGSSTLTVAPSFAGTVSGYASGGTIPAWIQRFPFASDTDSTTAGALLYARTYATGQSSDSYGFVSSSTPIASYDVEKFAFSNESSRYSISDLTVSRNYVAGQSSTTHGYTSGGYGPGNSNVIDKFPFAAPETSSSVSDVGDLTVARRAAAGQSSNYYGYTSGGAPGPKDIIDKFPFSADTNATDVGDLTQLRYGPAGQSSTVSGYTSGGYGPINTIDKFPFASDANATDVGNLTQARAVAAGQSSTESGYSSGGSTTTPAPPGPVDTIDKFSFAADSDATDVGDLVYARTGLAGNQH